MATTNIEKDNIRAHNYGSKTDHNNILIVETTT
jgi:hypothetical protein